MRKALVALTAAAALTATAASPVLANPRHHHRHHHHHHAWTAPAVGAVTGTVVGVGLYEGWWGSSSLATSLGSSSAAAATGGLIAGVGTVALIHAATTPCQGFHALFGGSGCVNGQYVGDRYYR
jgi:hypothetical protein